MKHKLIYTIAVGYTTKRRAEVGASLRIIHYATGGSLSLSEDRERAPDLKSSLAPSSSSLNTPKLSQQTSSQEVSMEESEAGGASGGIVCLSTASLASTSSSSSSEPRLKATQELSLPGTPLVLNGSVVMVDSASSATSSKPLPSTSTGAIPKSISFDKTAERGDKESLDDDGKSKRSFFRFKLPFKKPKGRSSSFRADDLIDCEEPRPSRIDTSDDILAKYRRKVVVTSSNGVAKQPGDEAAATKSEAGEEEERRRASVIDPGNVGGVVCVSRRQEEAAPPGAEHRRSAAHARRGSGGGASGCVRLFDSQGCVKLFGSLRDDYKQRTPYVSYLVHCRQSLLSTLVHLERLTERVRCERAVCQRFLMAVCVRLFLERRESLVAAFAAEFQQLSLADEKNDLLLTFLQRLAREMERDPLWQAASDAQLEMARTAIERAVVSRVYIYAMFPNGDGDVSRDQVLHEHMKKLSNVITPSHKDLRIPKGFCYECPWPSAQAELVAMSAHKTAGDKVACVLRCCTTILNLLSLAAADQLSTVPAADDLVPVLVYVLIKANPPSLLSTVAYVNSFYESRLEGEDRYWWVQFCSAIEFIKTMDYVLSD
ncbi:hypothetical protein LSTR_LSTR011763 [Laodelphax striatellus]|uniref:Receptor-mediated endocytosis protein 6 homolog n=1 Tax=Laodelphax striatellus TaxID=195883 RepID=A0A482XM93_LAOST|nr:hypothetical protein LSTR_LSTR011763 [Laodelphax striatellus]